MDDNLGVDYVTNCFVFNDGVGVLVYVGVLVFGCWEGEDCVSVWYFELWMDVLWVLGG